MKKPFPLLSYSLVLCLLAAVCGGQEPRDCAALQGAKLSSTTIISALAVGPGELKISADPFGRVKAQDLPPFCRVDGKIKPSTDSDIEFELWLPADWNGRYVQIGNGGLAGQIDVYSLMLKVKQGYAAAATDDGHKGVGTDGTWALGHPEKVKDFGYRAVHETNQAAKALIARFYGSPAKYSYFNGCSEGGREALMEAQRYPRDFNGILAGAPAHYWTKLLADFAWNAQALNNNAAYISEPKRKAIEFAALQACTKDQGGTKAFIQDPESCHFDPTVLLCREDESDSCLTKPQLEALQKIYGGAKNPRTGQQISPGYVPGPEAEPGFPGLSYSSYIYGSRPGVSLDAAFSSAFYGDFVYDDPKWDFSRLDFDKGVDEAEKKVGAVLNADIPDLSGFKAAGGKLIQYHGWYDGSPSPYHSVDYYDAVTHRMGGVAKTQQFYRLFMAPGMMHCGQGPGPNVFGNAFDLAPQADPLHNITLALEQWVEKGVPAAKVIATKYQDDDPHKGAAFTRPLCPYPSKAVWTNKGDVNVAETWTCVAPTTNSQR